MKYVKTSYFESKKSKFYGYLFEINNLSEVENILKEIKKEHKKARHVVYAYNINGTKKKYEDKEPSNTAGKQILDIIKYKNLDNVLIVVVRYFGGILLGAGPLTRAYSKTASLLFKD